jgi:U4/U6.U5 tri-snRNP-associated protein 1
VKNKRELNSSLKGATLGDPDDKDDETLKWVKRSRKKEKELAKKRLEELSKMDETFVTNYSESIFFYTSYSLLVDSGISEDLAGLKVAHDMEQLVEGEEKILTLKDSRILDNEGKDTVLARYKHITNENAEDELQNVELAEHERVRKNNELKIKRRDYTGYDDDEFVAGNEGTKRRLLAKYDEELEGGLETVRTVCNLI